MPLMKIWRFHIRPSSEDTNPVKFCIKRGIVGFGWPVDKVPISKSEYLELGENKYGYSGWRKAANALLNRVKKDDLIWFRGFDNVYYLSRITGDWEYSSDEENRKADIINFRDAEIYQVGTNVPGKLVNSFIPGATLQGSNSETLAEYSKNLFNDLSGTKRYSRENKEYDLFELLSYTDLEDLVALYLQIEKELIFVPSSRGKRNDTLFFEYELISKNSQQYYAQVKSGNYKIDRNKYKEFPYPIYLFSPAGYSGRELENTTSISIQEMRQFIKKHMRLLPDSLKNWIKLSTIN
jgi:hypothetical protein